MRRSRRDLQFSEPLGRVGAVGYSGTGPLRVRPVRFGSTPEPEAGLSSQEQLRILVETSPAAIVTIDENGFIELANQAANQLLGPPEGSLIGQPVAGYLPDLYRALRKD